MSINTIGRFLKLGTWGESHGPAIGATLDGCPPGIEINESMLQHWLDRRKPGQNKYTTQRREEDKVEILSGVFEGKTTGTPIQMLIWNKDQRSRDYTEIREKFRPGHADLTYWHKYGNRDYRGGGRSSARETASRVAAGGVAREIIKKISPTRIKILGYMTQIGEYSIDRSKFDAKEIEKNPFWCPDASIKEKWSDYIMDIRKIGDSIGSMVEVRISGVPPGIGSPLYAKLDSELTAAMMTINAVKSVEIGDGVGVVSLKGSENSDDIKLMENGTIEFGSNHSGGILGGISTGQDVIVRIAIKPASSILIPKKSVTIKGAPTEVVTKGRHDPCVGIRAVPVAEAMVALVLADQLLIHRGQIGEIRDYSFTGD